ncbi:YolD-like protein [Salsuginibacillus halophilus]|uniref:YolD-like protein n=1 Tax=Salsuginibacillus halophilus TaxID=517424 RepID=A0A2P8H3R0_9BACI|nr:YolD-like family protein [Salsuginibacillus halophilus]PSL40855.1 YolD-like protein [Salsuginibacillus halophilus]
MRPNKLTPNSNLRWSSSRMILPEHRKQHLKHRIEQEKMAPPSLDEQAWEAVGWKIEQAALSDQIIAWTYWESGCHHTVYGRLKTINQQGEVFHIADDSGEVIVIHFDCLVDLSVQE